jgi:hypothetical protein
LFSISFVAPTITTSASFLASNSQLYEPTVR